MTTPRKKYLTREQAWMRLCHAFCEAAATGNSSILDSTYHPDYRSSMGCCPAINNPACATTDRIRGIMRDDLAAFKAEAIRLGAMVDHFGSLDSTGPFVWPTDPEGHSARAFACWLMAQKDYPR